MKKVFRHIILLLISCLLYSQGDAQEEWYDYLNAEDSVKRYQALIDQTVDPKLKADYFLSKAFYTENVDQSFKEYDSALKYATQSKDTAFMLMIAGEKATTLCVQGYLEEGIAIFDSLMLNHKSKYEERGLAMHQFQYGKFLSNSNRLYDALEVYHEALTYFEKEGVSNYNKLLIGSIGSIYHKLERYDEALEMELKAIKIANEIDFVAGAWHNYQQIASINIINEEFDLARKNLDTAFSIIDTVPSMQWAYGHLYLNKAKLETKIGNYLKSVSLLDEKYERVKRDKNKSMLAKYHLQYARNYNQLNKFQQALQQGRKALRLAEENNHIETKISSYLEIAKGLEGLGLHEASIRSYKAFQNIKDSLENISVRSKVNQLASKYQLLKVEQEKQKLESENELKSLKLERTKERNYLFLAAIFALLLFTGMTLYFLKRKTQLNSVLTDKNQLINKNLEEKNILLKEIHHRVKNNLQVISSLLNLQSNYISDELALKAINEGKSRVNSMALIHQKLYQEKNLTGIDTQTYFNELVESLCETYDISENEIKIKTQIEPLLLDVDTMIPLGLITNELVSNALKHAFNLEEKTEREIRISLNELNNSLVLQVADNGKGIDKAAFVSSKSFGNKLIQAFLPKLDAILNVKEDDGTTFEFIVKKYEKAA